MKKQEEVWKDIPGLNNRYQASSNGRFRNTITNRILATSKREDKYITITLSVEGSVHSFLAHRLIGALFIPNPDLKRTINHKNGIKNDNRVINLEWATHSENAHHSFKKGRKVRDSRISESEKNRVRQLLNNGESPYTISKKVNISPVSIYEIKNGVRYDNNRQIAT